jgi:AcrR family transcriptional regulator
MDQRDSALDIIKRLIIISQMKRRSLASEEPGQTRRKLLTGAIELFGRRGFDATSIREIAKAAGVNIASIAYHFGGKEQLYQACIEHITETVREGLSQRLSTQDQESHSPAQAREALKRSMFAIGEVMLAMPQVASFVRVIVREQLDPSPAFDSLYRDFMEPLHRRLCGLWSLATGDDAESEHAKIAVFGLLGQVLVFRIARAGALRRMGWREIGPRELAALKSRIATNVDLLTQAVKETRP